VLLSVHEVADFTKNI